jgi:hypothetical protein
MEPNFIRIDMKTLDKNALQKLLKIVAITREHELCCDECFEHLDKFAELVLAGKPAADHFPLVQQHLEVCLFCKEEYEALIVTLQAFKTEA